MWHMKRHKTKIAVLAVGSGVSADVIKKLRTREDASTKAETADRIAAFYGKSTKDFMRCQDSKESDNRAYRLAALIDQLTPAESELIELQVQGILAARARR